MLWDWHNDSTVWKTEMPYFALFDSRSLRCHRRYCGVIIHTGDAWLRFIKSFLAPFSPDNGSIHWPGLANKNRTKSGKTVSAACWKSWFHDLHRRTAYNHWYPVKQAIQPWCRLHRMDEATRYRDEGRWMGRKASIETSFRGTGKSVHKGRTF